MCIRDSAGAGARQRPRRSALEPRAPPRVSLRLYTHPACLGHDTGPGHAERPDRLRAVISAIDTAFPEQEWMPASSAARDALLRVHDAAYVDDLLARTPEGIEWLDEDTAISPHSLEAALRGAGAGIDAVDWVMGGAGRRAFCAVRPPGPVSYTHLDVYKRQERCNHWNLF